MTVLFAVNGMIIGGYGGTLPSIRDRVGIDATQIALMLFCGSLAGILSMQIGGRLADSIGARKVSLAALPILIAAAVDVLAGLDATRSRSSAPSCWASATARWTWR